MLMLVIACNESVVEPVTDVAVVESYLVPGEAATVSLSRLIPFVEDGFADSTYIDSADVYIGFGGIDYLLSPVDTMPGKYVCSDCGIDIIAGNSYTLSFVYNGVKVSSETKIPEKPVNLNLSSVYYYYDPTGLHPDYTDPLYVYWDNPDGEYYQVVVEYLDESYKPISEYLDPERYDSFRTTSSAPVKSDTYTLVPRRQLAFWGNYRLILYKINQEYVDLYESSGESSLSITQPPSNIENGLGIFTGINSDTIVFKVIQL